MNVRELFAFVAPRYDFFNRFFSLGMDRGWRKELVKMANTAEDARILDLCTGTGEIAMQFARTRKSLVIGADFSPEMLQLAAKKIRSCSMAVELVQADVLALPFFPERFDVVSVGFGLRNLAEREQGLKAMLEMLKPHGRLFILELLPPQGFGFGILYGFHLRQVLPRLARLMGGQSDGYGYLSNSIRSFAGPAQIVDWMCSAGLVEVGFRKLSLGIAYIFYGQKQAGRPL